MELVALLVKNLGTNEVQAKCGAGLLLKKAKEALEPADFAKISAVAPEVDSLINDAPSSDTVTGEFEKMLSIFGRKVGSIGSVANLRAGFWKLGMEAGMIEKFTPIILAYVQSKGGDSAKNLLGKSLE